MTLGLENIILTEEGKYLFSNIKIENEKTHYISIDFTSKSLDKNAYIMVNNIFKVEVNSKVFLEVTAPTPLNMELVCNQKKSEIKDVKIEIEEREKKFNTAIEFVNKEVLIVTDSFPTQASSNILSNINAIYKKNGINFQVAVVDDNEWLEITYKYDKYDVIKGNVSVIKDVLLKQKNKVIIFDKLKADYLWLINGYTNPNQKIIFRVSDNTSIDDLDLDSNKYFVPKIEADSALIKEKDNLIKKYANSNNIYWVFSSKTLEKRFKDKYDLKNTLVSNYYFYKNNQSKSKKQENSILVYSNFDNKLIYHADDIIRSIIRMSKSSNFDNFVFNIYGTGNYYNQIIEPLRAFKNVNLYEKEISIEEKSKLFAENKYMIVASSITMQKSDIDLASENDMIILNLNNSIDYSYSNVINVDKNLKLDKYIDESKSIKCKLNDQSVDLDMNGEIKLIKRLLLEKDKYPVFKKSNKPVLTIVIPSYNVENYLYKCLNSLIFSDEIGNMEILVVNDGSKDKTHDIAYEYEKLTKGIIRIIDKENGGHGSAVNKGMELATGKYFKILDSDDWFDTDNLTTLIKYLKNTNSDLILNRVCRDYSIGYHLDLITEYDYLEPYYKYNYSELIIENYGLRSSAIFAAYVVKTETLKKAKFNITEKKLYADHEYDALMLKYVESIEYVPLEIYMYLIGREGQSISLNVWSKRYKDHQNALFTLLDKIVNDSEFPLDKREFIARINLTYMVTHQINTMYDMGKSNEIVDFLKKLKEYNYEYETIKNEILTKNLVRNECMVFVSDNYNSINTKKNNILRRTYRKIKRILGK